MSESVSVRNLGFLGFPKYEVDTSGSVWSFNQKSRFRLKPAPHNCGYLRVVLNHNRRRFTISVHRLVLLAFVGPCPESHECRHENRNRHDNRLANLSWGTRLENAADRIRHGTTPRGEKSGLAKLCAADVLAIMAALAAGNSKASQARRFQVSHAAVCDIAKKRSWGHLD